MSVELVKKVADTQMGVSMKLTGEPYWLTYLQDEVSNSNIDQAKADQWEKKYDGYQMLWTFDTPAVAAADKNIDAVCINGDGYSNGGFCCGIKYTGALSPQPEMWARWVTPD